MRLLTIILCWLTLLVFCISARNPPKREKPDIFPRFDRLNKLSGGKSDGLEPSRRGKCTVVRDPVTEELDWFFQGWGIRNLEGRLDILRKYLLESNYVSKDRDQSRYTENQDNQSTDFYIKPTAMVWNTKKREWRLKEFEVDEMEEYEQVPMAQRRREGERYEWELSFRSLPSVDWGIVKKAVEVKTGQVFVVGILPADVKSAELEKPKEQENVDPNSMGES